MLLPPADEALPGPADADAGERPMKRRLVGAPAAGAGAEAASSPTTDAMTGRLSSRLTATLAWPVVTISYTLYGMVESREEKEKRRARHGRGLDELQSTNTIK